MSSKSNAEKATKKPVSGKKPKRATKKKPAKKKDAKEKAAEATSSTSSQADHFPKLKPAAAKSLSNRESGIYHTDCISGMQKILDGGVDLVFADPPFNIGYKYDVYEDKLAADEYLQWSEDWMREVYRILKSDGSFWLAIGDDFAAELKLKAQQLGFHCRSWVIWYYTFGVNCKFKFTRSHTHLLYFVKDVRHFTFNSEDLENRIPSARMLVYNDKRTNPKGRLPDDTWIIPPDVPATFALRPQDMQECFLPNESDWYFPRVAGTFKERAGFHGCQMPEQLLGRIIRSCSNEGDFVVDPFSGSASTLIVAKKLKRKHIAFELSEEYVAGGRERLDSVNEGDELVGAAEPKMSALPTWKKSHESKGKATSRPTVIQPAASQPALDPDAVERARKSLVETLKTELPQGSSTAEQLKSVLQKATLQAFAAIADRYSMAELSKSKRALAAFHKQCVSLGIPGDAEAHLVCLKESFQSHGQLF